MGVIGKMFSSNKEVSSKRIIGSFCIFLYICILIGTFIGLDITIVQAQLLSGLLFTGGGLIGIGVMDRFGGYGEYGSYSSYNTHDIPNDNPDNMSEN